MGSGQYHILLLEDHVDTADVMARLLRQDGYRITIAHTLTDARKLCEQKRFDLLICDIDLPDGSGLDVLEVARRYCGTKGIVVSGYGDDVHRHEAARLGFSDYLLKPVSYPALLKVTRRALRADENAPSPLPTRKPRE